MIEKRTNENGLTLLVTLLLMSVMLAVTASLLNITIKQYQISGISRESEMAFQAANAGLECARYYDVVANGGTTFDVPGDGGEQSSRPQISCMDQVADADDTLDDDTPGLMKSGDEQRFQFDWGDPNLCTIVSVYKFHNTSSPEPMVIDGETVRADACAAGFECTVIYSRGYNTSCADRTSIRTVERELTQIY